MLYASDSDEEPEFRSEEFIRSLKRTQLIQHESLYEDSNYKLKRLQIQEILNLEKHKEEAISIRSKRSLLIMLRLDELEYNHTNIQDQQRKMLSSLLEKAIDTKVEFNNMHVQEILLAMNIKF